MKIKNKKLPFSPIIVIGAARSGTNILRDCLTSVQSFETWPCDEINAIWRHGNLTWPNDAMPKHLATPTVAAYIRRAFYDMWTSCGRPDFLVEKTCANSLRIPFVDTVFPEARYIYIVRNGFDVIRSAEKRWRGEMEISGLPYFLNKARYTPFSDLAYYSCRTLYRRAAVKLKLKQDLGVWGPIVPTSQSFSEKPLLSKIAHQWLECVNFSDRDLIEVSRKRVYHLRYEDFVRQPDINLENIMNWLNVNVAANELKNAAAQVRDSSVGTGSDLVDRLEAPLVKSVEDTMQRHGYF